MNRILIANWGVHLLHATWQSAVVALAMIALTRATPRLSSRLRYSLLLIAAVKFALPPMLPTRFGLFSALPQVGSSFFWPLERPFVLGPLSILGTMMWTQLIGAVIVSAILLGRVMRLRALVHRATPASASIHAIAGKSVATGFSPSIPRIVISKETSVPFVCGILRPTIVLPRQAEGANLQDVLAHEIGHVISDDTRHNAMQAALAVIWWWNPIYWWLAAELRRVREERCDDFVLAAGLSNAWQYSRSIVDVAEGAPAPAWVGMASPVHALEPRLRRLADARIVRSVRLTPFEIAAVAVVAAVLTPGLHLSF